MADTETAPPAPPCTLVIFGATGDLTRRLLMPALRNLRRDGLLPDDFALVGVASRDIGDDGFRDRLRKGMEQFKGGNGPADIDWFLERSRYLAGKFEVPETYQALAGLLDAGRSVLFYLATPPSEFAVIAGQLGKAGLLTESDNALAAPHHREAVRPRPAVRGGAQQGNPGRGARGAGLPHRPLSRQGDGAEHPGLPLRQRLRRAAVEPRPHRPRADHRRRDGRCRAARQVLRRHRARCATWCPITCSSSSTPDRHGAAELPRRRRAAQREGQGARRRAQLRRQGRPSQRRARPVRRGQDQRRSRSRPIARRPTCRPIRPPRPTSP